MSKPLSEHAHAAKLIRQSLKKAFPSVKFSVRADSYSMGDSVRISYEDGPSRDEVDTLVSKYQYGHFDSMNDMYENSNLDSSIPQVKHVLINRSISESKREELEAEIIKNFGIKNPNDEEEWWGIFRAWKSDVIWRAFTGSLYG